MSYHILIIEFKTHYIRELLYFSDIGSVESKIPIKLSSELELGKSSWMRKSTVNASLLVKRHAKDSSDIDEPVTKKQVRWNRKYCRELLVLRDTKHL